MENLFCVREEKTIVSLSGVQFVIREMIGEHQVLISKQDANQRSAGFIKLLKDCIVSIGSKTSTEITDQDIKNLLEGDRRFILWELRKLSNPDDKEFVFDYEFPVQGGKKLKQRCVVSIDESNFPVTPYKWVRDEMVMQYAELNGIESMTETEIKAALAGETPLLYGSYSEMLEANRVRKVVLPRSKAEVTYDLITTETSEKFARFITADSITSHTQLEMHNPRYVSKTTSDKQTFLKLNLNNLSIRDIEALRKDMLDVEGSIDTTVVVKHETNAALVQQIDLVSLAAFFFPSLAV